jgi:hypothetical protein
MILRRMDAEIIMKNIFEVFDSNNTGKIIPNELLWIFSMSLKGKGKYISTWSNISAESNTIFKNLVLQALGTIRIRFL